MITDTSPERPGQLARLADRLQGSLDPHVVLPVVAAVVAQGLPARYVAVYLKRLDAEELMLAAEHGIAKGEFELSPSPSAAAGTADDRPATESSDSLAFPLLYKSETVGQLIVVMDHDRQPTSEESRLLTAIARGAGAAAQVVRQAHVLQLARERLVLAREEERRRLRRNLHDTIGPTLSALSLKAGAVRNLIQEDPGAAQEGMNELRQQIQSVITAIRRVVYDLRPPALDELGIIPAIREQARQFSTGGLQVLVDAPDQMPPLPAAVEVAVYRIVMEALTNVDRHAHAHQCRIFIGVEDQVNIEVADDGIGLQVGHRAGVGIASMRERVSELGGSCTIESPPEGGTRVLAMLPIGPRSSVFGLGGGRPRSGRYPASGRPGIKAMAQTRIRILLADDHRIFREGLRALLVSASDLEVVGEAGDGNEVIAKAAEVRPDVILMDLQLPGLNGVEATRRILDSQPNVSVLVLTMFEDTDTVLAAMRAGARGYLLKDTHEEALLRSVRAVANGEALFGPAVAERMMRYLAEATPPAGRAAFPELTDREREVLSLLAQGLSNQEVAARMGISLKTARNHVSNILARLQVADRTEAVARARAAGLGAEKKSSL